MNEENKINGVPNINEVPVTDTPAESFENLYGNNGTTPQMQVNPGMVAQPVQPAPQTMQPNPGMVAQPVQSAPQTMQPNPNFVQQPIQPAPVQPIEMQPNPGTIIMPESGQMTGNIAADIDADRMQSIEEQLSKTSQYNPADLQQEKIEIPTDNQYEKNKSGLVFVIILFIILAVVIAFLPQITKLIK